MFMLQQEKDIAVCPIILARMQSGHSLSAGRTGCSAPVLKEPPLVLLCIQWLMQNVISLKAAAWIAIVGENVQQIERYDNLLERYKLRESKINLILLIAV